MDLEEISVEGTDTLGALASASPIAFKGHCCCCSEKGLSLSLTALLVALKRAWTKQELWPQRWSQVGYGQIGQPEHS